MADNTQVQTGTGDVMNTKAATQDDGSTVKTVVALVAYGQEGLNPTVVNEGSPLPVQDDEAIELLREIRGLLKEMIDLLS